MFDMQALVHKLPKHVYDVDDQNKFRWVETHGVVRINKQLRALDDDLQRIDLLKK